MKIKRYLIGMQGVPLDKVQGYLDKGIVLANDKFANCSGHPRINSIKFIEPNTVEMDVDCNNEKDYNNHLLRYAVGLMFKDLGIYCPDTAGKIRKTPIPEKYYQKVMQDILEGKDIRSSLSES